jgi:peptidoglycan/LPS O-acetylase OafA/YrhL
MRFTLTRALENRQNNFDFMRLMAAVMVIFSHSFPLTQGTDLKEPLTILTHRAFTFGTLGVDIFFIISGFLVFFSLDRTRSVRRYVENRVLRIVPGLAVVVGLLALVVGPLVTTLSLGQYYAHFPFLSFIDDHLPGVFPHNPLPWGVDGSLWTIKFEVLCYVGLGILGYLGWAYNRWVVTALFICTMTPWGENLAFGLLPFFASGMLAYAWRDRLPIRGRWAIAALASLILSLDTGTAAFVVPWALAYLVLWFAFTDTLPLQHFGRYGDFSYGLYIYAFPVQQLIVMTHPGIRPLLLFAMAILPCFALAFLSWHIVERRALAMKGRIPTLRRGRDRAVEASA